MFLYGLVIFNERILKIFLASYILSLDFLSKYKIIFFCHLPILFFDIIEFSLFI